MSLRVLDANKLAPVKMTGIIEHWSGGPNKATSLDLTHYHVVTEGDGNIRYGVDIALNSGGTKSGYAAHTRNANTNRIGHSMAGMLNAVERPFSAGPQPLTLVQWNQHVLAAADLCDYYNIAVARDKVLFHAEVQSTLGIKQAGKWDVARLPFDLFLVGAHVIGDKFRDEVLTALKGGSLPDAEPVPGNIIGGTCITTAKSLNFRRGPSANSEKTGSLPAGITLTILGYQGDWLNVRTPGNYTGWVHGGYVKLLDVAPLPETTQPDPIHTKFSMIHDRLDYLEANPPSNRDALENALARIEQSLTPF